MKVKKNPLAEIKQQLGVTQERLASAMGVKVDRVKSLLGGKAVHLRAAEISGLVKEFHLNPDYFLDGETPLRPSHSEAVDAVDLAGYIHVPHYDISASAGPGAVVQDETVKDHIVFSRDWVVRGLGLDPKALALIDVRGDSMSPTLNDGDLILLDTREGQQTTEGIYAINLAGGLLVKRLRLRLSGVIEVISDNSRYGTETISGEQLAQLRVVGRVVWQGRRI